MVDNQSNWQEEDLNEQKTQKQRKNRTFQITCIILLILLLLSSVVGTVIIKDAQPASTEVKNGLSAYELAVQYGYDGTVEEWLSSLTGKSAYEIAVENGYSGTEAEWTASLTALTQQNNTSIKTASFSSKGELLITLSDGTVLNLGTAVGADGKDGKDGKNGQDGKNGADGVGVSNVSINAVGQLVLKFSDGKIVNLDR